MSIYIYIDIYTYIQIYIIYYEYYGYYPTRNEWGQYPEFKDSEEGGAAWVI